ncbi:hypothetical protein ACI2K4_09630 [Micromonospora sp. NPDC050397]|uniref:hypothetical protein n=1 Tax=Micromonospora sp. NPDC050397 TaxID=3364279 RepID=UPI00384F16E4
MRIPQLGALFLTTLLGLLAGCTAGDPPVRSTLPASQAPAAAGTGCGSPVETGPLPEWARAGFTGDSSMPHVMGDRGEIVGAIFGHPLSVSRPEGPTNKILWVSRLADPPGDLVIEASLEGSDTTETRRVSGGPGPSIIDLPQPGCWHLTLTWPGHTDTMDLVYR